MTIDLPATTDAQAAGWHALFDVHAGHPTGWTLVGGQMVHLWCAERGAAPTRATDDLDAVLDVRGEPSDPGVLMTFTTVLMSLGFRADGTTPDGHQHRWVKDGTQIDVLIPDRVGERTASRQGAGGGTTVQAPGAQQALDRSEDVQVTVGGRTGTVRRPSLLGALVVKAAAYSVTQDTRRERHVRDFLTLCTLVEPTDQVASAGRADRKYLTSLMTVAASDTRSLSTVEGAENGLAVLRLALGIDD